MDVTHLDPPADLARTRGVDAATATDYPSPRLGLANLRRDNQRRRRWDPKPSKVGTPGPPRKRILGLL
jgi:hypothetical protein